MSFFDNKGSITIFICICISGIIVIFFSMSQIINRKYIIEEKAREFDLGLNSILSEYDKDIFEDYGLLCLSYYERTKINTELKKIMNENDVNFEKCYVYPNKTLMEREILKNQINRYMEKRIIYSFKNRITSFFDVFNQYENMEDIMKYKSDTDSLILNIEKLMYYLQEYDFNMLKIDQNIKSDDIYEVIDKSTILLDTVESIIEDINKLDRRNNKYKNDYSIFLEDTLDKLTLIKKTLTKIEKFKIDIKRNISILYQLADLKNFDEIAKEELEKIICEYVYLEIDFSDIISKVSIDESLKKLDFSNAMSAYLNKNFLFVNDSDIKIPETMLDNIPYDEGLYLKDIISKFNITKAFKFADSIKNIKDETKDNLLINEYCILKYNSQVNDIRQGFFKNELEYIIFGSKSQNANLNKTQMSILLMRFLLNFISIYKDSEKVTLAKSVGYAISGLTWGIGGELYANAVISVWAFIEAYDDVKKLIANKKVPLIKSGSDFYLGFLKGNDSGVSGFNTVYNDYIRILLMLKNNDKKLGRIQNIIYLNRHISPKNLITSLKGGMYDEFVFEKGY